MKWLAAVIAIVLFFQMAVGVAEAEEDEEEYVWVYCNPNSLVNVRSKPSKHSEIVGNAWPGDKMPVIERKGSWVHVECSCEAGEGWIRSDFVSIWEPEDYGPEGAVYETICGNVFGRYSMRKGKNVYSTLKKKGTRVLVYLMGAEWSVTSKGFIMTEFLTEVIENGAEVPEM